MPAKPLSAVEVGNRIREHRRARGLILADLARKAGLTMEQLQRIEQGLHDPTASVLWAIARGLGLSPGDILAPRGTLSDEAREFIELCAMVPSEVQQALVQIMRASLAEVRPATSSPSLKRDGKASQGKRPKAIGR